MQRTAKWTGDYQVHSYEIGPDGHVRIQKVCNYLQDAAGCHARELGVSVDQLLPKGLTWVLSKLRLHMVRLPKWGEVIRIMTWPADVQRLFAIRDFRLLMKMKGISDRRQPRGCCSMSLANDRCACLRKF